MFVTYLVRRIRRTYLCELIVIFLSRCLVLLQFQSGFSAYWALLNT